jgi:hypothetical protein
MYHSSAFARERDKIRHSVLEGLGWTLFRVWSTEWWTHPARALDTLHDALTRHLEADRQKRAARQRADEVNVPAPMLPADGADVVAEVASTPSVDSRDAATIMPMPEVRPMEHHLAADRIVLDAPQGKALTRPVPTPVGGLFDDIDTGYVFAHLDGGRYPADPERFYAEDYEPRLSAMIDHVIDIEGPIHEDVLVRRIARHHGFQRAGRQIRHIVIEIAKRRRDWTQEDVGLFFWSKGTDKEHHAPARYKNRDDELRAVEYICKEELRAIQAALSLSGDPVELARALGITRLSQGARKRLSEVLDTEANPDI